MEKLALIIAIITTITSLGLVKILITVIKEGREAINAYKKANEDNHIDAEEKVKIQKESLEFFEALLNLGFAVKKALGIIKKKKS